MPVAIMKWCFLFSKLGIDPILANGIFHKHQSEGYFCDAKSAESIVTAYVQLDMRRKSHLPTGISATESWHCKSHRYGYLAITWC
jgi:hypothetical protein